MNYRSFLIIFTLLSSCVCATAQKSVNIKPKWVGNTPKSLSKDYYFIEVHTDVTSSLPAARVSVKQEIASNVERTDKVSVSEIFDDHSIQSYEGGRATSFQSEDSYQLLLNVEGSSNPIKTRRVDEYWESSQRGGSQILDYHALYAVERTGETADFSEISCISSYGVHGLWRSALIPGWGQLYKGSPLKGGLIMGATVACIGGIIYTDCMRSSFNSKIFKTHDVKLKRHYADQRTAYASGRNICIGALCAVYVYNLVDAIVAPGARRIVMSSGKSKKYSYYWSPALTEDNGIGITATVNF